MEDSLELGTGICKQTPGRQGTSFLIDNTSALYFLNQEERNFFGGGGVKLTRKP